MVEIYPTNIWSRAKWQQERDAVRVPKGACPKISVGEELDRFHQEMVRGVGLNASAAAKRLEDRARTYVAAVQQRHPDWARRVGVQIADRARGLRVEFDKIANARVGFNKAVLVVQQSWRAAELDIGDCLSRGGSRLASRHADLLLAGIREIYAQGQRLAYVTDKLEKGILNDARKIWMAVDGGRAPTQFWLEDVNDLRMRLRPI